MKKKIIIELNGVIFTPFEQSFKQVAIDEYGKWTGNLVNFVYKHGIGHHLMANKVQKVFLKCASAPQPRQEALAALDKITRMPGVCVEFCTQNPYEQHSDALIQKYRTIAPCLDTDNYNIAKSNQSKRNYIIKTTGQDKYTMNYILDTDARHLDWPARWRIIPIFVGGNNSGQALTARTFDNMSMVLEFFQRTK